MGGNLTNYLNRGDGQITLKTFSVQHDQNICNTQIENDLREAITRLDVRILRIFLKFEPGDMSQTESEGHHCLLCKNI